MVELVYVVRLWANRLHPVSNRLPDLGCLGLMTTYLIGYMTMYRGLLQRFMYLA